MFDFLPFCIQRVKLKRQGVQGLFLADFQVHQQRCARHNRSNEFQRLQAHEEGGELKSGVAQCKRPIELCDARQNGLLWKVALQNAQARVNAQTGHGVRLIFLNPLDFGHFRPCGQIG